MRRFREEVSDGKILCRDIVNVDWTDMNQVKSYRGSEKFQYCLMLAGKTAKLVGELLEKARDE